MSERRFAGATTRPRAGIEGFFVEVGELVAGCVPDLAEIDRLSAQYDVFFPAC